jgi:hypothetical protein
MKILDLSKCKTNDEVCELVSARMDEIPYDDLITEVNKSMVFQERAVKAIYTGLSVNMNVFLSGESGFGKSEIIKLVLNIYKIPYTTLVGYKNMPVDALLGVPNMAKLLDESEYEVNFNKSIFSVPGVLIAEEFTDVAIDCAVTLKTILTERGYMDKNGKTESLICIVIIAANKDADDMSIDESTKALYDERFPIKEKVYWENYGHRQYLKLLNIVFKDSDERALYFMSKVLSHNSKNFNIVSPRKAINVVQVFLKKGINFISNMGINIDNIKKIQRKAELDMNRKSSAHNLGKLVEFISSIEDSEIVYINCLYTIRQLEILEPGEDNVAKITETIETLKTMMKVRMVSNQIEADYIDDLICKI